jgi:hypothetical protein
MAKALGQPPRRGDLQMRVITACNLTLNPLDLTLDLHRICG